jgi:hypothetical protein
MAESGIKQETKIFIPKTKKSRVYEFLRKKPESNIYELYFEFPGYNKNTLKYYKNIFSKAEYGLKYNNLLVKYNELLKVARSFYYTVHLGKFVPVEPLNKSDLELVKQLEEMLKNG